VGCAADKGESKDGTPSAQAADKPGKFPSSRLRLPLSDVGDRGDGSVKGYFSKSTSTALTDAETHSGARAVGLLKEFTIKN